MTGYDLAGKVALVTGASRGVGAAVAVALAGAGATVACAARSTAAAPQRTPGTLDDTVDRIEGSGGRAIAVPTNLAEPAQVEAMVATTVERLGRLDVLVNNAAVTFVGDLDIPLRRHELVMAINLTAPLVASRAAAPHMAAAGGGRILSVSSVAALLPIPGLMSYGISKIGLERLTVDLARMLQRHRIAVNCFRIDLPVASEGFVANTPGVDRSTWEPCEVAAEGVRWMIEQPAFYSGRRESMLGLRGREGIMPSRAAAPTGDAAPTTELFEGLAPDAETMFRDPATGEPG
ncbi:MAG TPA: SDR family NAD(P)-dependent oxidoreductase [Acidimicrobiales bacterium]